MQISHNGIELIKQQEGFRATAYRDTASIWTIGYGSTHIKGIAVEAGQSITEPEAEAQLILDLAGAQTEINKLVKVPLTQNMFDALVSFTYNEGEGKFAGSTMLRVLNLGQYANAANEFPKWVYSGGKVTPGLVSRRAVEKDLFLKQ